MPKVSEILAVLDRLAPPELAEAYDNVGLLSGRPDAEVSRAYVALDLTPDTLAEAVRLGANLIVTHHPILFHARKNVREDDPEGALLCALVRANVSLIAAHTNLDNAPYNTSDLLAGALGLTGVEPLSDGMRVGLLEKDMDSEGLRSFVEARLGGRARLYGLSRAIRRVAVCAGAGGCFIRGAAGADAFVTGECKYHETLEAAPLGLALIEAGHWETEQFAINALYACLQNAANALQWKIEVFCPTR